MKRRLYRDGPSPETLLNNKAHRRAVTRIRDEYRAHYEQFLDEERALLGLPERRTS